MTRTVGLQRTVSNMRAIDADRLLFMKADLTGLINENPNYNLWEQGYQACLDNVQKQVNSAPTLVMDISQIVMCCKCKYRCEVFKPEIEKGGGICMKMYDTGKIEGYLCRVKANDFCSHGELKEW